MTSFMRKSSSYNLYESASSVAHRESEEKANMRRNQILEQKHAREQRQTAFNKFVTESRDFLLSEAMYNMLEKSLPENTDETLKGYGRSVIESFVKEEDSSVLLSKFKTKTLYLSELAQLIETTHREVVHDCDGRDAPFTIANSKLKAFHASLDNMVSSSITKAITTRVAKAEQEFIEANLKDKKTMEDLAKKTEEKINDTKNKDAEKEKEIKQEHAALYRRQVDNLLNRKKSILESIIGRLAIGIVQEETIRPQFTKDDGKLDMQRIIEMGEVMYTVLEMVNTTKIRPITKEYLNDILASIK